MSKKTPLILSLVILILLAVAYWDDQKTIKDQERKKTENVVFAGSLGAGVDRFSVVTPGGEKVELKKDGATWQMISPVVYKGNREIVSSFVKSIKDLKYQDVIKDPKPLSDYGLDKPSRVLSLTSSEKEHKLLLGNKTPVGNSVYFMLAGSPEVYIGGQSLALNLSKGVEDYRDKTLGIGALSDLSEFKFITKEGEFYFLKKNNKWVFAGVEEKHADEESLGFLLSALRKPIVKKFIDSPSEDLRKALDPAKNGTVFLGEFHWANDGQNFSVTSFYENNGEVYASMKGSGSYLVLEGSLKSEFQKTEWDFVDKKLVEFDSNDVREIEIDSVVFVKNKEGVWFVAGDAKNPKEHPRLFLLDLEFGKALAKMENIEGLGDPKHTVKIKTKENIELKLNVWSHPKNKGELVIKKSHSPLFYVASDDLLENMQERVEKANKNQG